MFNLREVDNKVAGRLALVTGASGGIGSYTARVLAAEGCDMLLHYSGNKASAESLAQDLSSKYPDQLFAACQADLSDRESTRTFISRALSPDTSAAISSKHSAVSILVANAGLGRRIRDVADIEEDDWDEMFEVNARSQFVVVKACLKGMRAQGWGRVVLVGSIASKGGGLNGCHYAATKGALSSMGLNLATLLAPEGVTVNIVSPAMIGYTGMIPTPKSNSWSPDQCDIETLRKEDPGLAIASSIPVARLGTPDEVANVILLFVKSGYMTGQDVQVVGGLR